MASSKTKLDQVTKSNELNLTDLQMKQYMVFNSKYLGMIRCKSMIPLIYIHTKYCYSNRSHAKEWKVSCFKCKQKLRNTKIWHCRCEQGKCKNYYNFCDKCYNDMIDAEIEKQSIIKTWTNQDIKKWIMTAKWLNIHKKEINNFKQYLIENIFKDINGDDLISLTEIEIINLSHKLPWHYQYGFKDAFIMNKVEKLENLIENYTVNKNCKFKISTKNLCLLISGYLQNITDNALKYIGTDIIVLISEYIRFGINLEKYDLKLLMEAKVYVLDEIIMKPYSKLLIGPKVKGIKVFHNIEMEIGSIITSSIHYEKPANINIECGGDIVMNGGMIDIQTTNAISTGHIHIKCHDLKMDKYAKMRTVEYYVGRYWYNDPCTPYNDTRYGNISITLQNKMRKNWISAQFSPLISINGKKI